MAIFLCQKPVLVVAKISANTVDAQHVELLTRQERSLIWLVLFAVLFV